MTARLLQIVRTALPHEDEVRAVLRDSPSEVWQDAADEIAPGLPSFDVTLALGEGSAAFASAVARHAGASVVIARPGAVDVPHVRSEHWYLEQVPLVGKQVAFIVTPLLEQGFPEIELAMLARQAGLVVAGIVAGVEFTSLGGRSRMDMLSLPLHTLIHLAHTPAGLQFERRGAGGELLIPLP